MDFLKLGMEFSVEECKAIVKWLELAISGLEITKEERNNDLERASLNWLLNWLKQCRAQINSMIELERIQRKN